MITLERPPTKPELQTAPLFGVPVSAPDLAKLIDHTMLHPAASDADIQAACDEAIRLGCRAVCVNGGKVAIAARRLSGSGVHVVGTIGFPFGTAQTWVKLEEACLAVRDGADEIDVVMNIGALRSGHDAVVRDDLRALVEAVAPRPVKAILEVHQLTVAEKQRATELAIKARAAFVVTSTGYLGPSGGVRDVAALAEAGGGRIQVKAVGTIRTLEEALALIEAGATRIGTRHTAEVLAPLLRSA